MASGHREALSSGIMRGGSPQSPRGKPWIPPVHTKQPISGHVGRKLPDMTQFSRDIKGDEIHFAKASPRRLEPLSNPSSPRNPKAWVSARRSSAQGPLSNPPLRLLEGGPKGPPPKKLFSAKANAKPWVSSRRSSATAREWGQPGHPGFVGGGGTVVRDEENPVSPRVQHDPSAPPPRPWISSCRRNSNSLLHPSALDLNKLTPLLTSPTSPRNPQ